ncbi:MAG: restriction endonuclease [Haloarculaceae archaeon]
MNNVTDIREVGQDASVLTDTGSGGLISRGVLSEGALADHLGDDETPQYVLRNKKHGVTVEGPEGTDEYAPDTNHCGVAVVSDVRVLFAAGQSGGDVTLSVSLGDVVDVRTENGLLGGAFVVETVDDERYRFPCRGDLKSVQEYLDAAVGVWTRAQRHVEEAHEQVDRLRDAFESGNADVVLAATAEVEETLADAREAAGALDGARARIDERAAEVSEELAALERRACAAYAEQARERAHVRWDDEDYETAMDDLDEASEAYAAAEDINAAEPGEELLAERREALAEERERLAGVPVDRAEHAVDVAAAADDPGSAVDRWETAVERYETALSLDWGRDDRRFEGDSRTLRDDLADAARQLVGAHCDHAREHIAEGDSLREDHPEQAGDTYDRAAAALAAAREVTRERVPNATDEVDAVAATLADRLEETPGTEEPGGAEADSGRTAAVSRPSEGAGESDASSADDPLETAASEPTDGSGDTGAGAEGAAGTDGEETTADSKGTDSLGDAETVVGNSASEESNGQVADRGTEAESADPVPSEWRTGDELIDDRDRTAPTHGSGDREATTEGEGSDGRPGGDGSDADAETMRVTDPATVDPDVLPSLVARVFEAVGWSTTVFGESAGNRYDLVAATDDPVSVTVCVWTLHPETAGTVDAATVDRYASYVEGVEEADAAALCSAAPVSETAHARAADNGFDLLDADDLAHHVETLGLDLEEV